MTQANRPTSNQLKFSQKTLLSMLSQRSQIGLSPAIFLDRDGTLNVDKGYICDAQDVELFPDATRVVQDFRRLGFRIIIITNQSAIARGLLTIAQFEHVSEAFWRLLQLGNASYDGFYFCPHSPEDFPPCECRKPEPGLVFQAALDLSVDLSSSYFIGDTIADVEAGHRAGCKAILVLTGKEYSAGAAALNHLTAIPDSIQENLEAALNWIEGQIQQE